MTEIVCRAKIAEGCLNGRPSAEQFGEDLPLDEDSTFDGESIVCDVCYIALMPFTQSSRALHHEIDDAIKQARKAMGR